MPASHETENRIHDLMILPIGRYLVPGDQADARLSAAGFETDKTQGQAFDPEILQWLYRYCSKMTFPRVIEHFFTELELGLSEGAPYYGQDPLAQLTGHIIGVISLVDPRKVPYDDAVLAVSRAAKALTLKHKPFRSLTEANYHFLLGGCVGRAIAMNIHDEFNGISYNSLFKFFNTYLKAASLEESDTFTDGLLMSIFTVLKYRYYEVPGEMDYNKWAKLNLADQEILNQVILNMKLATHFKPELSAN